VNSIRHFRIFYARQHICYSTYMLSPVRLSVCLSDGWISSLLSGLWGTRAEPNRNQIWCILSWKSDIWHLI